MNNNRGFTLIEVMLAMVILTLVFSGFTRLIYGSLQVRKQITDRQLVMSRASAIMEYLKTVDPVNFRGQFTGEEIQGWPGLTGQDIPDFIRGIKIETEEFNDNDQLYRLVVTLEWEEDQEQQEYSLTTLFRKGGEGK